VSEANKQTEPDTWVRDPQVCEEFDITPMTRSRWDNDPRMAALGGPPPIKIRKHNFRSRKALERFKQAMFQQALRERASKRRA
jgi:hypothetical protein